LIDGYKEGHVKPWSLSVILLFDKRKMWRWKPQELLHALGDIPFCDVITQTRFGSCDRKHRARCCRKFTGPSCICALYLYFSRWAHDLGLWNIVYMPISSVSICRLWLIYRKFLRERSKSVQTPISTMLIHEKNIFAEIFKKYCQMQIWIHIWK